MKGGISTIASFLLSVFFICIVIFLMLEVLEIQYSYIGFSALIFPIIDFLILITVIGFGKGFSKIIGIGMYAPVCTATVLYTIVNLAFNCIACDMHSFAGFVLINLVTMFVYLCVVIPIAVTGYSSGAGEKEGDGASNEIKYHNVNNQK